MINQNDLKEMFDYDPSRGVLIHKHTVQGGKQKGSLAGSPHNKGYLQICICRKKYLIHRLIWLYHHGKWPNQIDHINRNRSDNRIENLRECDYSQNHGNRSMQSNNTSGAKGVFFDRRDKAWMVYVAGQYKGWFKDKQSAIECYDKHAKEKFGEFACTNKELKNARKTD